MKVLLIYPNARRELIGLGDLGAIAEPLALEYLGTTIEQEGHEVALLDLRLHLERLGPTLDSFQPDLVGLTGYSMHVLRNLEIAREVRQRAPQARVVVGGHHATLLPEDFFAPEVDFVVKGEGTGPLRELLRMVSEGRVAPGPGIWAREGDTFRFGGEQRALELDAIPPPDRSLPLYDRGSYYIDWMRPIALLRTTVGCPYRCSFCSLWKVMDGRYFRREEERVVEELKTVWEPYVFLVDDEPFVDPRRMMRLAEAIQRAGIRKEFYAYCRIDTFLRHPELMQAWREIGLKRVFFGVEAVTDAELADFNKRLQRQQVIEGLERARQLGISVFSNFIIRPDYREEDFEQVLSFIQTHDVEYPSFTVLTPLPGTDMLKSFDAVTRKQPNGRPDWSYFDLQHAVTQTRMSSEEFHQRYRALQDACAPRYQAARHPFFQGHNAPSPALTALPPRPAC